ncbi:MAG: Bax inhibitor-1 family protein [Gammaproteobacteria bacterium]|nr:Bax inhibitor-1 family protein [Gammaproteobacteria bacterium]
MNADDLTPESLGQPAVEVTDRSQFINRTYMHLLGAIFLFAGLEFWVFQTPYAEQLALFMLQKSWLAVLGAFIVASWIASHVAHRVESKGAQYAALAGFVVAEAIIFIPMFYIALAFDPAIIEYAVAITLGAFVVLTAVAMFSGRDFSFLRSFLIWGGVIALGTIVMGLVIGFHLGTFFSMAMIGLAGASILYDTSKILKVYPEDRYIAAALELFASIALMLWYVLRFFMSRD